MQMSRDVRNLQEYCAVVDLRGGVVTLSADRAIDGNHGKRSDDALSVSPESVTLPPRVSVLVEVMRSEMREGEAVTESN